MFQEVKTIYNFYKSNIQKNKLGFYIFILVILTIISSIINSIYPISIGLFFDLISSYTDNLYYLYIILIIILISFLLQNLFKYLSIKLSISFKNKLDLKLSDLTLSKLFQNSKTKHLEFDNGYILQLLLNDVDSIKNLYCDIFIYALSSIFQIICYIIFFSFVNYYMIIILLSLSFVVLFIFVKTHKKIEHLEKNISFILNDLTFFATESLNGIKSIIVHENESYFKQMYLNKENNMNMEYEKIVRVNYFYSLEIATLSFIPILFIIILYSFLNLNNTTIGTILTVFLFSMNILNPILQFCNTMLQSKKNELALHRLINLISSKMFYKYDKIHGFNDRICLYEGKTKFNKAEISFKFNDFIIRKGMIYLICGKNGYGKSSLLNLLTGNCDGEITGKIDNTIVNNFSLDATYLLQDETYFEKLSVFDNIVFDKNISMNEVLFLCDELKFYDIKKMIQTNSNKNNLSGGEKKKIFILRTLITKKLFYVFDEPTNELDSESINSFCRYLEKNKNNNVIIIVSHLKLNINGAVLVNYEAEFRKL